MRREELALQYVHLGGRGLEIGPSYNPLVPKSSGARVSVVDHAEREALVEKYRAYGLSEEELARIEPVDHVWNEGSLAGAVPAGPYDYIVASHLVEHTVDLVGFLNDCAGLLAPEGRLALVVPDKRFCFDRFQPLTSLGAVVDAHLSPTRFHPAGSLVDHQAYACKRGNSTIAWTSEDRSTLGLQFPRLEGAAEVAEKGLRQETYEDIHRWRFVPASFRLLLGDLRALGYVDLGIVGSHATVGYEFFVSLGKDVPAQPMDRLAMLLAIEAEHCAVAGEEPTSGE